MMKTRMKAKRAWMVNLKACLEKVESTLMAFRMDHLIKWKALLKTHLGKTKTLDLDNTIYNKSSLKTLQTVIPKLMWSPISVKRLSKAISGL